MELISLIAALVVITFIGFNIFYLVMGKPRGPHYLHGLEVLSFSYGMGLGFISLEMLIFYLFGMKFSIPSLAAPWAILIAVNVYRRLRCGVVIARAKPEARGLAARRAISFLGLLPRNDAHVFLDIFLMFGIAIEVFYAFFRALIKPIESYDAIAIYAIKAKIFFIARAIPENYFPSLIHGFPHPDYPLNIPLAETFIYLSMRSLNEQLVKIIFPLFFVRILSILYFAIRRFASRAYALLFTFILASIPMFNAYATNAYHEIALSFYYFSSVIFLLAWIENKDDLRALAASAVMVALAGWTKNEGMLYCVINALLVLALSTINVRKSSAKSIYSSLLYVAVIGAILAPWIWIKHRFGIVNDEINLMNVNPVYLFKQIHKLGPIFYELQRQLFGPKKWILLWPIAIFAAVFNYRKIFSGIQRYISISLIMAFCGYVLFYMVSYVDVVFFTSKTWGRFLLHFLPLLVLWLAYMFREDIKL